jgi:hypothetical protein
VCGQAVQTDWQADVREIEDIRRRIEVAENTGTSAEFVDMLALTAEASRSPLHQHQAGKRLGKRESICSSTRERPTVHGRLPAPS